MRLATVFAHRLSAGFHNFCGSNTPSTIPNNTRRGLMIFYRVSFIWFCCCYYSETLYITVPSFQVISIGNAMLSGHCTAWNGTAHTGKHQGIIELRAQSRFWAAVHCSVNIENPSISLSLDSANTTSNIASSKRIFPEQHFDWYFGKHRQLNTESLNAITNRISIFQHKHAFICNSLHLFRTAHTEDENSSVPFHSSFFLSLRLLQFSIFNDHLNAHRNHHVMLAAAATSAFTSGS